MLDKNKKTPSPLMGEGWGGGVNQPSKLIKTRKCPICGKLEAENKYKPFCSKRCADVDLGNWFNESYAIPAEENQKTAEDINEE